MLPHLAKSFVMAMLYITHPLQVTDLETWVRPDSKRERDHALSLLERLHVFSTIANPGQPRAYALTNPFAASLRLALTGGGNHKSFGVPCDTPDPDAITSSELDNFARRQWESVLGYMVGSTGIDLYDEGIKLSVGVKKLLQLGGLVEIKGRRVEITQDGFAFILQEVNAQVWTVLVLYLENAETVRANHYSPEVASCYNLLPLVVWFCTRCSEGAASDSFAQLNMDPVDVLSFLFMLGSLELGQDYSKATLTPTQIQMLDDLGDFGIVYQTDPSSPRFYPTRLATTLTSDAGALRSVSAGFDNALRSSDGKGFIVIETNYRIYAYTSSKLQIAVLQLFTRLSTRYPNMVSGKITRESIRRAVAIGITSDQIVSYLNTHAHPQMRKNNPILPPTVVDQIR
ncbi:MAG: RNA polymerase II transcription factor B 52 kDa subunit, partial [Pleopsidium flavum]